MEEKRVADPLALQLCTPSTHTMHSSQFCRVLLSCAPFYVQEELEKMNDTVFLGPNGMLKGGERKRRAAQAELKKLGEDADPLEKKRLEDLVAEYKEMRIQGDRLSRGYLFSITLLARIPAFFDQENKWVGLFAWFKEIHAQATGNTLKDRKDYWKEKGEDLAKRYNDVGGTPQNIRDRTLQYWLGFWEFMEYLQRSTKEDNTPWFVDAEINGAIAAVAPPSWQELGWVPNGSAK